MAINMNRNSSNMHSLDFQNKPMPCLGHNLTCLKKLMAGVCDPNSFVNGRYKRF